MKRASALTIAVLHVVAKPDGTASNNDGVWNTAGDSMVLNIQPAFYLIRIGRHSRGSFKTIRRDPLPCAG